MPKDGLLNGNFSDIGALVVIVAVLLVAAVLIAFVYLSVRRGADTGAKWLFSADIYFPERKTVTTRSAARQPKQDTRETVVVEPKQPTGSVEVKGQEEDVIERLRNNLNGHEFEEFVAELWKARGWDARVTSGSGDGNIDVIAEHDMVTGENRTNREMIQAKHKSMGNKVGPGTIRKTKGSERVKPRDNLVVVTTGSFTSGAKEAAEKNEVELVDKNKLREMARENMGDTKWV